LMMDVFLDPSKKFIEIFLQVIELLIA